jgi:phosphohistidine swiveling domain-containing protein
MPPSSPPALPQDVVDAVVTVAAAVGGDGELAVRSSATAEDLLHASFAGQYRSLLHVSAHDREAVLRAVRLVFASLWHPAPVAYRQRLGVGQQSAAMAVVLMAMVPARRAGVVFTQDPAGAADVARVETVEGLAESLVSGQETPEVMLLARDATSWDAPHEVAAALQLALLVETRAGTPQDVEWAWDGTTVWVVQARPITTRAGEPADEFDDPAAVVEVLDLTTAGIGEMLPGALPPLRWDLCSHLVEEAFRSTFADVGATAGELTAARAIVRRVRGRAAMDFGLLSRLTAQLPGADVAQLEEQYFGSARPSRAAPPVPIGHAGRGQRLRGQWRVLRSRRRADLNAEIACHAIDALLAEPPERADLADRGLLAYHLRLVDLAVRTMTAELGVAAEAAESYRRLEDTLAGPLGTVDAAREAARLTTLTSMRLGGRAPIDPSASAAVFAGPTWAEEGRSPPPPVAHEQRDDPIEALRRILLGTRAGDSDGIRAALRMRTSLRTMVDAADQLDRRERTKAALLRLGGEVRAVHLEIGRRLCSRGAPLERPDEVELLSVAELRAALLDGSLPAADIVARRRRAHERAVRAAPLPPRFSGGNPQAELAAAVGDRLEGWAVSSGRYSGAAVVVHQATDSFPAGAVLVAEATDPSWSPLFMRAGAIVLERGGPLSHAAILARELGVPAVTNLSGATTRLAGQWVTVDGDAGLVVVDTERQP